MAEADPFAAFKENAPPTADEAKKGVTITPAAGYKAGDTVTVKVTGPKKTRKPRQAKELKLPISTLLEIGSLSEEESGALLSIGAGLQKLPKKSRQKISAALSKIFG